MSSIENYAGFKMYPNKPYWVKKKVDPEPNHPNVKLVVETMPPPTRYSRIQYPISMKALKDIPFSSLLPQLKFEDNCISTTAPIEDMDDSLFELINKDEVIDATIRKRDAEEKYPEQKSDIVIPPLKIRPKKIDLPGEQLSKLVSSEVFQAAVTKNIVHISHVKTPRLFKHPEPFLKKGDPRHLVHSNLCNCDNCKQQCKNGELPSVVVPYFLKQKEMEEFAKIFNQQPHCDVHTHDHALAAAVRHNAQRLVENFIYATNCTIVDIYGSGRLPSPFKWSKMPIVTPSDNERLTPGNDRYCRCEFDCTHNVSDVGLMVDVIYYLSPSQIASHCLNTNNLKIYSLHHTMKTTCGQTLCGTYRWTTEYHSGKSYLSVAIGRDQTENHYTHQDMSWLSKSVWKVPNGVLTYVSKGSFGPMSWGVFQLHLNGAGNKFLERQTVSDNHIDIHSYIYDVPKYVDNWKSGLDSILQFLGLKPKYKNIVVRVPSELFGYLCRTAMFIPDREKAVPLMLSAAKRWFNKAEADGLKLNPLEFSKYLPHVVCAALVCTLPDEIGAMHYHLQENDHMEPGIWRQNPRRIARIFLTLGAATLGFLAITHQIGFGLSYAVLSAMGLTALTTAAINKWGDRIFGEKKVEPYRQYTSICMASDLDDWLKLAEKEKLAESVEYPPILGFTDELCGQGRPRIVAGSSFSKCVVECHCLAREFRQPDIISFFVSDAYEPLAYTNCTCNVYAALRMRWMRQVRSQDADFWLKQCNDGMLDTLKKLFKYEDLSAKITPDYIKDWLARYPINKQKRLTESRFNVKTKNDITMTKFFCKRELLTKSVDEFKPPEYKPRGINCKDDIHQMITGPSMFCVADHIVDRFDGKNTPFIYGSKRTPDEVGSLLFESMKDTGFSLHSACAAECDLKMCETTMRGYLIDLENHIYKNFGISEKVRHTLFKKDFNYGVDYAGNIRYKTGQCRESGATNTSVGNTVVYAAILYMAFHFVGVDLRDIRVVIGGDDCVLYYHPSHVTKATVAKIFDFVRKMGLEPEVIYHDNAFRARFYSGYFIPFASLDSVHDITYSHVPMFGKALVKCGTFIVKPGLDPWRWLKDIGIQRQAAWSHIPILNKVAPGFLRVFSHRPEPKKLPRNTSIFDQKFPFHLGEPKIDLVACDLTWSTLADIYDVTVETLKKFEKDLEDWFYKDWIGKTWHNDTLKTMYATDIDSFDTVFVKRN